MTSAVDSGRLIRRAKVADADWVHAVLLAAKDDIPLCSNFGDDAYKKWVRGQCRERNVWVLEREGVLAGVMVMAEREILYLVTAGAHRQSGVGQALVEHATDLAWRRFGLPALARVKPGNRRIIGLLEKLEFVVDHDRNVLNDWMFYRSPI